jgi:subtilisin family serine protease
LSDVELSWGTSLSAPLTAGAAALVIEAYRKFHQGASPTPALVKQILTSTASDLGVPPTEQGAGLLNSYKAVRPARRIDQGQSRISGRPRPVPIAVDQPAQHDRPSGSLQTWPVMVTNTGAAAQTVQVSGRTFGPAETVRTGSVVLHDGSSPRFGAMRVCR